MGEESTGKKSRSRQFLAFLKRLVFSTAVFCLVIFFVQDFLIFPAASPGFFGKARRTASLPERVHSYTVTTVDGESLEVWEHTPEKRNKQETVVVMFHGNGSTVDGFHGYQMWLGSLGLKSYSFDYRGFGQSSGWPSEEGLYKDADAVWDFVKKREKVDPDRVLIFGISIGSGPAAYLASKIQPQTLMLLAGYSSLKEVVNEQPIYRPLSWMLSYEFPVARYISDLHSSCVVLAHGQRDTVISFENMKRLESSYKGVSQVIGITSKKAGHNDLLNHTQGELVEALRECMTTN